MITRMERLPNEILLHILSYLSWSNMLTSLWSLNIRFNSLVYSIFSMNDNLLNTGLVFTEQGLSYNKCCSTLFPLILNSSSLSSSIRRIHFDGTNSIACDLSYEWLFNDKKILRFPNLKSLILTRCGSIEPVVQSLFHLIEHQLDELTLTFDESVFHRMNYVKKRMSIFVDIEKQLILIKQLLCRLFSAQCQLKSLRLDIGSDFTDCGIQRCLASNSYRSSNLIQYQLESCVTLRRLHIRLMCTYVLENLIEYVPNLEQMSVQFVFSLGFNSSCKWNVEMLRQSNESWFNKVPKLRCFTLKTFINEDLEFVYLKWLLNNLNYVKKLKLHLKSAKQIEPTCQNIWKSLIDANFIRQYCLPDTIPNLIYFNFYICSQCQLSSNDIEKITNSFKIHPFFISHQWTNVKCLFDPIMSYQHLFSSFPNKLHFSHDLINYSCIFNWPHYVGAVWFHPLHPSLYLFLEQFNDLFPNISFIRIDKIRNKDFNETDLLMSLEILSRIRQYNWIDIPFRNVTKIQFGTYFNQQNAGIIVPRDRNEIREKVLAHLISMTVQLKYLLIEQFIWLLHVVQYASNELRTNALSTVRYAEFALPSCHSGSNETIRIGKQLVPFLSTYMPHLQTLRLWRPDDFPWTSIRPDYRTGYYPVGIPRWMKSLRKPKSIARHVAVFEQNLSQLIRELKEFTFLDIYGKIDYEKIEPYRLMVQTHFPHCRSNVEISRFCLWL